MPVRSLRRVSVAALIASALAVVVAPPPPAAATIPSNGKIAYISHGYLNVVNSDGTGLVQGASADSPAWSPDGQRLGYRGSNGYFVTSDIDGSNPTNVFKSPDTWVLQSPAWSPDGKKVAYNVHGANGTDIFIHNIAANTDVNVRPGGREDVVPVWSPDGRKIAFVTDNNISEPRIWIMNADGTGAYEVPNQPAGFPHLAHFSPDGTKLLFTNTMNDGTFVEHLFLIGVNGSGLKQVGPTAGTSKDGSFSPDGKKIVFQYFSINGLNDPTTGLWTMNLDGTGTRQVIPGSYESPVWQPIPSPDVNIAPHAYGTAKQTAPLTLTTNGSYSIDDDGWILRYEWRWGDNTPAVAKMAATHKYAAAGTYLVRLTVFDNNGAYATKQAWVTVT